MRGLLAELQVEQRNLAPQLGLAQSSFSRRVTGFTPFTLDEVDVLASLLNVSPLYLLGYSDLRARNDNEPRSETGAREAVRHVGLEPTTRWLTLVPPTEARTLPPMPAPEPAPAGAPAAAVISLAERRATSLRSIERKGA